MVTAVLGATVAAVAAVAAILVLVLLDGIFKDGSHDGASDGTQNTVVSFVACKATRETACESTAESSFAILGSTGSILVIVAREINVS
jgi:hypothetical protein